MLLYIRGGSIITRKDITRRSSKAMSQDPYTLIIAFDQNGLSSGSIYVDDGESFEYKETGAFVRVNLSSELEETNNSIKLKISIEGRPDLVKQNLSVNKVIIVTKSVHKEIRANLLYNQNQELHLQY